MIKKKKTSSAYGKTDYRALLRSWLDGTPEQWGFREANATCKILGAALPMSFNRTQHYRGGLLLVGDAGGMGNPFNGEGIAYAMESARLAAECTVQAMAFFFQAEDGIRDGRVTGVQTCALPISTTSSPRQASSITWALGSVTDRVSVSQCSSGRTNASANVSPNESGESCRARRRRSRRSEERRVGKEWRSGGRPSRPPRRAIAAP